MFTVKVVERHREKPSVETIFEAAQVRKDGAKIYCDVEDGQIIYDQRETAEESNGQTMFVMNRYGATVSTYHL